MRHLAKNVIIAVALTVLWLLPGMLAPVLPALNALISVSPVGFTLTWDFVMAVCAIAVLDRRGDLRQRFEARPATLAVGAAVALVAFFAGNIDGTVIALSGDKAFAAYQSVRDAAPYWMTVLLTCVSAPLAEECLMRGALHGAVRETRLGPIGSALVTSAVFALAHGTAAHLPLTFLIGIATCIVYEATRSVLACAATHAVANAGSMFLIPLMSFPDGVVTVPFAVLVGVVGTAFAVTALVWCVVRDREAEEAVSDGRRR